MGYNVNPMLIVQAIKNGQNPQQLMLNIMQNTMSYSPFGANLLSLAQQGNTKEIERIARNIAQQRGLDYDKEFANFVRGLGLTNGGKNYV
jgi:hypothetical protein